MKSELSKEQVFKVNAILDLVSSDFKIPLTVMISHRLRSQKLDPPRRIAATALRQLAHLSFCQIGRVLNRDHSTIIHAVTVGKHWPGMPKMIAEIESRLPPMPPYYLEPFETLNAVTEMYGDGGFEKS